MLKLKNNLKWYSFRDIAKFPYFVFKELQLQLQSTIKEKRKKIILPNKKPKKNEEVENYLSVYIFCESNDLRGPFHTFA